MLLLLIAGAAVGLVAWIVVGTPFAKSPVTKAQIEHTVAQRPRGHVVLTLCNEEVVPSQTPRPSNSHTWTCDTYLGRSTAHERNGPSYEVIVTDGAIKSIRQVPPH
jgi:Na+/glutamate symporter